MPFARHPSVRVFVLFALGLILGHGLSSREVDSTGVSHGLGDRLSLISTAKATSNPLSQLISPAGTLTLVANTLTALPHPAGWSGRACTIVVWNNTATPVYFGGPAGVGAVTVAGGMPMCTDATACITGPVSMDVGTVALIAGVGVAGIRYVFGGGC